MGKKIFNKFYHILFLMLTIGSLCSSCSGNDEEDDDFFNDRESPAVTGPATDINPIGATITCRTNIITESNNMKMYVQYCQDKEVLERSNTLSGSSISGRQEGIGYHIANYQLSGTEYKVIFEAVFYPNTTYYYRACITNNGSIWFGKIREFRTSPLSVPTINDITDISKIEANTSPYYLNQKAYLVTIKGNSNIDTSTEYSKFILSSIECSTDENTFKNNRVSYVANHSQDQNIEVCFILQPNTKYYFRPCLYWFNIHTLNSKYHYGEIKSFTTPE